MQHYKQITIEQRYQISGLLKAGLKAATIADEIGVNQSTIFRELSRNKGQRGWRPKQGLKSVVISDAWNAPMPNDSRKKIGNVWGV